MATVKHVEHDDGSHSIGVEVDGKYVPLAQADAGRVEQLRGNTFYNPEKKGAKKDEEVSS
jgi:hypothetical protein